MQPREYTMVEKPILDWLVKLCWISKNKDEINNFRLINNNEINYKEIFLVSILKQSLRKLNSNTILSDQDCDMIINELKALLNRFNDIKANQEFLSWLRGEKSLILHTNEQAQIINLIDFRNIENNEFIATNQFKVAKERRLFGPERNDIPDIVLFINGIPLVVIEAKDSTNRINYLNAIEQLTRYQDESPALFVPNILICAADVNYFKVAPTGTKEVLYYFDWKDPYPQKLKDSNSLKIAVYGLFERNNFLDIIYNFIIYVTQDNKTFKVIARYNQFRAANKIVKRVIEGKHKRGLIWHTQGSGKSYTMLYTAWKLRRCKELKNPTVFLVIDRKDLDTQISGDFDSCDFPNFTKAWGKENLFKMILESRQEVIITTIQKFGRIWESWVKKNVSNASLIKKIIDLLKFQDGIHLTNDEWQQLPIEVVRFIYGKVLFIESEGLFEDKDEKKQYIEQLKNEILGIYSSLKEINFFEDQNIIALCDEAHRTQEGELAIEFNYILNNAFKFGFTGTPIDKKDRNTHRNFGIPLEAKGWERYLDYYSISQSIEDGFTKPIKYEGRLVKWSFNISEEELEKKFFEMTPDLDEKQRAELKRKEGTLAILMKKPERIAEIAKDIAEHYKNKIAPNGFKAQLVAVDRTACAMYKEELDKYLDSKESVVIFTPGANDNDPLLLKHHPINRDKKKQKKCIDKFKDANSSLKIIIVTDMLLTGFNAPIEQTMYLDKPMKDHNLLQAIARTNRPYKTKTLEKPFGLIVDYFGVFQKLQDALNFDEEEITDAALPIDAYKKKFPDALEEAWKFLDHLDKSDERRFYDELKAFLGKCEDNQKKFEELFEKVESIYEVISPDPYLYPFLSRYKALCKYYDYYLRELRGDPGEIEKYGAKTRELIYKSLNIDEIKKNFPTYIIDQTFLNTINRKAKESKDNTEITNVALDAEIAIKAILTIKSESNPVFELLKQRLERIIRQKEEGFLAGLALFEQYEQIIEQYLEIQKGLDKRNLTLEEGTIFYTIIETLKEKGTNPDNFETSIIGLTRDISNYVKNDLFEGWSDRKRAIQDFKQKLIILNLNKYPNLNLYSQDNEDFINKLLKYLIKIHP